MKRGVVKIFIVMLSFLALTVIGFSQEMKKSDDKMKAEPKAQVSKPADQDFMMDAATGGMTEVELGNLGVTKATNADVKTFAQRMVDDHTKAGEELKGLATSKNVTLPAALGTKEKKIVDDMSKLSGEDFDRKFMETMVKDHDKAVALFEKEAANGKDAETKAWAEKTLPTLRDHQKQAHDIAAKVGAKVTPMKTDNK
jgi:putative membrane protein